MAGTLLGLTLSLFLTTPSLSRRDGEMTERALTKAQREAAERLLEARGSIRAAFESLDLGFDYDDALAYLRGSPSWQAITTDTSEGLMFGAILGFAITAVEADRLNTSGQKEGTDE